MRATRKHVESGLIVGWSMLLCLVIITFCACFPAKAHAGSPAEDIRIQTAILYGESASDPEGWIPKLNTYNKARRPGESLTGVMKRVSSAYRTKSRQYRKAINNDLTAYEKKVYKRIQAAVKGFKPDKGWKYTHHENLKLYSSPGAALAHLKKAWGPRVDFASAVQIGREHYFAEV